MIFFVFDFLSNVHNKTAIIINSKIGKSKYHEYSPFSWNICENSSWFSLFPTPKTLIIVLDCQYCCSKERTKLTIKLNPTILQRLKLLFSLIFVLVIIMQQMIKLANNIPNTIALSAKYVFDTMLACFEYLTPLSKANIFASCCIKAVFFSASVKMNSHRTPHVFKIIVK